MKPRTTADFDVTKATTWPLETMFDWYVANMHKRLQENYPDVTKKFLDGDKRSFNEENLNKVTSNPDSCFDKDGNWISISGAPFYAKTNNDKASLYRDPRDKTAQQFYAAGASDYDKMMVNGLKFSLSSDLLMSEIMVKNKEATTSRLTGQRIQQNFEIAEMAAFIAISGTPFTKDKNEFSPEVFSKLKEIEGLSPDDKKNLLLVAELGLRILKAPTEINPQNVTTQKEFVELLLNHSDETNIAKKCTAILSDIANHSTMKMKLNKNEKNYLEKYKNKTSFWARLFPKKEPDRSGLRTILTKTDKEAANAPADPPAPPPPSTDNNIYVATSPRENHSSRSEKGSRSHKNRRDKSTSGSRSRSPSPPRSKESEEIKAKEWRKKTFSEKLAALTSHHPRRR